MVEDLDYADKVIETVTHTADTGLFQQLMGEGCKPILNPGANGYLEVVMQLFFQLEGVFQYFKDKQHLEFGPGKRPYC